MKSKSKKPKSSNSELKNALMNLCGLINDIINNYQ